MKTNITFTSNEELLGYLLINPDMVIVTKCNGKEVTFKITEGVLQYSEEFKVGEHIALRWEPIQFSYFEQWEFPQNHTVKLRKYSTKTEKALELLNVLLS